MESSNEERFQLELELLQSMYPDQITFAEKARELRFIDADAKLELQIPDGYLSTELPIILTARVAQQDLRDAVHHDTLSSPVGEEILDSVIVSFLETCTQTRSHVQNVEHPPELDAGQAARTTTVVVWLHHLLNTNKRKQALSPVSPQVNGLTKPGYPGVLIFAGPEQAVQDHVNDLKHLNWQAFQVRLEDDEAWSFAHGSGMVEVESMKDVVTEVGDAKKDLFMEAMRMK
jgi:hypothetical protein